MNKTVEELNADIVKEKIKAEEKRKTEIEKQDIKNRNEQVERDKDRTNKIQIENIKSHAQEKEDIPLCCSGLIETPASDNIEEEINKILKQINEILLSAYKSMESER